jgi:hypothetical protein
LINDEELPRNGMKWKEFEELWKVELFMNSGRRERSMRRFLCYGKEIGCVRSFLGLGAPLRWGGVAVTAERLHLLSFSSHADISKLMPKPKHEFFITFAFLIPEVKTSRFSHF